LGAFTMNQLLYAPGLRINEEIAWSIEAAASCLVKGGGQPKRSGAMANQKNVSFTFPRSHSVGARPTTAMGKTEGIDGSTPTDCFMAHYRRSAMTTGASGMGSLPTFTAPESAPQTLPTGHSVGSPAASCCPESKWHLNLKGLPIRIIIRRSCGWCRAAGCVVAAHRRPFGRATGAAV
jgi:hypothetical protein